MILTAFGIWFLLGYLGAAYFRFVTAKRSMPIPWWFAMLMLGPIPGVIQILSGIFSKME